MGPVRSFPAGLGRVLRFPLPLDLLGPLMECSEGPWVDGSLGPLGSVCLLLERGSNHPEAGPLFSIFRPGVSEIWASTGPLGVAAETPAQSWMMREHRPWREVQPHPCALTEVDLEGVGLGQGEDKGRKATAPTLYCTTDSEPPASHQVLLKAPRGWESHGSGVWCLMRAEQMDGCHCWVSGLELQSPSPCPVWVEAQEPESHPGPGKRRGCAEGQEGRGCLFSNTVFSCPGPPQTSYQFSLPQALILLSSWPLGQGKHCPPCLPQGGLHLIPSSCSQHPAVTRAALFWASLVPLLLISQPWSADPKEEEKLRGGWGAGVSRA